MYKSLLVTSLFSLSALAMTGHEIVKIKPFASHKLGAVDLYHTNGRFHVMQNNRLHSVEEHAVDKTIRLIDTKKLSAFLTHGHIAVNKTDQGEFTLRANAHGKGGGVVGAWIGSTLGYGTVTFLGHGTIHLVAACTGPWYAPTAAALTKMMVIPIHSAACAAGVAGGIAGGVATGPV